MKQLSLIIFTVLALFSCNSAPVKDVELHNLVTMILGEFSNAEQTEKDASFRHLNLKSVRIWKDRPGYWVYTEVHEASENNNIYSQRILEYERVDSLNFKSTSYKILNEKEYKFGWQNAKVFNKLTLDSLRLKEGCQVYFKKKTSTIYSGKTNRDSCLSSIKSVNHITSSFVVSKNKISVWTRGYSKEGKHIFGKISGPYKYKKIAKR
ncbi:hypothetical protein D1816_22335 [Aquimarina sp. AD10]|uniref:chromophore lyase CpcT/CpeT n=1 Tax=Aquimarina sp. AD10 TaxID=1714849 RepID=UPI000E5266D2|nr:chromophore lyase CpcT/CpeT [Aquimarina sp. AD10]AXT62960.1 hypothetical protein D1816_22335 [Aquimarina sp. AD10]RKM94593.1 hypothetical protein D7033_18065 [Aquimarina sp. AD10]